MTDKKTVIVTGAGGGIGGAIVQAFLEHRYNVVATSLTFSSNRFEQSLSLALVEGDIGQMTTAEKVAQTAIDQFDSIDHLVNNAGMFSAKPFTDYTAEEFQRLISTNLNGFAFLTQLAVRQILRQGTGGSVTSITASLAENPMAGIPASLFDDHQGRARHGYSQPRDRIREEQHPLQRGRARPSGNTVA